AGLTYNDGERVFGSSTPLYTLLLAAGKVVLPPVATPALAVRANLLFSLLSACALAGVIHGLTRSRPGALFGAGVFLAHPSMQSISTGGMESFLFLFLVLASVWSTVTRRFGIAAACAGLAPLARPEGFFILPLVTFAWWRAGRPRE